MAEQLVQLGAAVVIVWTVLLIIDKVLKFSGENDKGTNSIINVLSTLITTLTTNITKNTEVLIRMENFMGEDRKEWKNVLNRIENTLQRNYSEHDTKINEVRAIISQVKQSLDDTIPIPDIDRGTDLE